MAAFTLLTGYVGSVWQNLKATLAFAGAALPGATPSASALTAQLTATSFRNGRDAITASLLGTGLATLYDRLSYALTLPVALPAAQINLVTYRVNAVQAAAASVLALPPTPLAAGLAFPQGLPTIADPGLLEWLAGFAFEGDLGGQIDGLAPSAVIPFAAEMAAAWAALQAALVGANVPGSVVDAVEAMAAVAAAVAAELIDLTFLAGQVSGVAAWNTVIASPSITRAAWALMDDPTSATWQQTNTMRYVVGTSLQRLYTLCFTLRQTVPTAVRITTVRQGDSLMRIAQRELGDFERFQEIAALNQLIPPYIAAQSAPGVAAVGSQIFLPTTTAASSSAAQSAGAIAPSYSVNYLGVDLYLGPLNQPMTQWTGDFARIVGYQNFALSLGRRLQTTLGSLLFHGNYGSRVPPEVGKVAVESTISYLSAYATSAILSDPRAYAVTSIKVTLGGNYSISIVAQVQPNGSAGDGEEVNEVIQPVG